MEIKKRDNTKILKSSYKYGAASRLDKLELSIKQLIDSIQGNGITKQYSPIQIILIEKYIIWINKCIAKHNVLLKDKLILKRRKNGIFQYIKQESQFLNLVYKGINLFKYLLNCDDIYIYYFSIFNHTSFDLNISPLLIDSLKPSQLMYCFVNVYCTQMDPNALWLSKDNLIYILKSNNKSLLKVMLFHAFSKLIKFPNNALGKLLYIDNKEFESMLSESYNNPTLDNLTALTMLVAEYFFNVQYTTCFIYCNYLINMRERYNQLNQQYELLTKEQLIWKQRIWEIIDFFNLIISAKFNKKDYKQQIKFKHLKQNIICVPTIARNSISDIFVVTCNNDLSICTSDYDIYHSKFISKFQASYYAKVTYFEIEMLKILRKYTLSFNYNTSEHSFNNYYLDGYTQHLIEEINILLNNTPSSYKQYNLVTKKQAFYLKTYGKFIQDNTTSFGTYAYIILNRTKLALMDPLCFTSHQMYKISLEFWQLSNQVIIDLWEILQNAIIKNIKKCDVHYHIMNNLYDFLPLINYSLNVLVTAHLSDTIKAMFYNYLSNFITYLKSTIKTNYGFKDDEYILRLIKERTVRFNLTSQFSDLF